MYTHLLPALLVLMWAAGVPCVCVCVEQVLIAACTLEIVANCCRHTRSGPWLVSSMFAATFSTFLCTFILRFPLFLLFFSPLCSFPHAVYLLLLLALYYFYCSLALAFAFNCWHIVWLHICVYVCVRVCGANCCASILPHCQSEVQISLTHIYVSVHVCALLCLLVMYAYINACMCLHALEGRHSVDSCCQWT